MKRISHPWPYCKALCFLTAGALVADLPQPAQAIDLGSVATSVAKSVAVHYATHPTLLVRDVKELHALLQGFLEQVEQVWGKKDAQKPEPKKLVKYTDGYGERVVVEFDQGVMRVESIAASKAEERLRQALTAALLTTDDPGALDLFSDRPMERRGTPFLYRQVVDAQGNPIGTQEQAERFAAHAVRSGLKTRPGPDGKNVHFVEIPLAPGHGEVRAAKVRGLVERYATQYQVSRSLVYAVIKTESDFNPYAVSWVPAFGLMQIVPATGGRDAYAALHGQPGIPSREYLFDPERNIRMGSVYLNMILTRFLAGVKEEQSREYLAIASYNGGIGRVLRCFAADKSGAIARINGLTPAQVFSTLQEKMPQETREYLRSVQRHRRTFSG